MTAIAANWKINAPVWGFTARLLLKNQKSPCTCLVFVVYN
jgi:hypothetical protein